MRLGIVAAVAAASLASVPASALIVWKGRDGKAYASVKDCFTNNPQCLPEQGRMAAGSGDAGAPAARSAERTATRAMCKAADGWMHPMPCGKGEAQAAPPE